MLRSCSSGSRPGQPLRTGSNLGQVRGHHRAGALRFRRRSLAVAAWTCVFVIAACTGTKRSDARSVWVNPERIRAYSVRFESYLTTPTDTSRIGVWSESVEEVSAPDGSGEAILRVVVFAPSKSGASWDSLYLDRSTLLPILRVFGSPDGASEITYSGPYARIRKTNALGQQSSTSFETEQPMFDISSLSLIAPSLRISPGRHVVIEASDAASGVIDSVGIQFTRTDTINGRACDLYTLAFDGQGRRQWVDPETGELCQIAFRLENGMVTLHTRRGASDRR